MYRRTTSEILRQTSDVLCSPSGPTVSYPSVGSQTSSSAPWTDSHAGSFEQRDARRTTSFSERERPASRWALVRGCAWILLASALTSALVGGIVTMYHNQYAHIHDHIDAEYNSYVDAWQANELTDFYNMKWTLFVDDQHIMDMQRTAEYTKQAQTVLGTSLRRNLTTHVEFSVGAIIPFVFYPSTERQTNSQQDPSRWKQVTEEMKRPQNFRLRGVHEASGEISWVTLDNYPFVRSSSSSDGLTKKQCQAQQGLYEGGQCIFMEYLREVCIRIAVDATSPDPHFYDIDHTHAGPDLRTTAFDTSVPPILAGCYPEDGLQVPQYSRLPLGDVTGASHVYYLPKRAEDATRMVVRHAHDPELMEKVLKFELRKELSAKKQLFWIASGVAMVSLALLVPVTRYASPTVQRASRKLYLEWKYPNSLKGNGFRAPLGV